jgi:hypothetical protein
VRGSSQLMTTIRQPNMKMKPTRTVESTRVPDKPKCMLEIIRHEVLSTSDGGHDDHFSFL